MAADETVATRGQSAFRVSQVLLGTGDSGNTLLTFRLILLFHYATEIVN